MLANLLSKRRDAIVEAWIQLIVDAYPDDTSKFLRGVKDPFANPVGGTYRRAIPAIFDGLVAGETGPSESMLDLIRVRAVQQPEPALHVPPQPSDAPQVLPAHLGAQQTPTLHTPLALAQSTQTMPALPQRESLLPLTQVPLARQQPEQLAAPQVPVSRYFLAMLGHPLKGKQHFGRKVRKTLKW